MLGRLLVSPATYVTQADFASMPLDYDLTGYTASQQTDILVRASGMADSIMRRSLLAQERIERKYGNGSNRLSLGDRPIIYVRKMQFFLPGVSGYTIPPGYVEIDAMRGEVVQYAPLALQGIGYIAYFPDGLPIDVTYGVGYGYNPVTAPAWTSAATSGTLAAGQYTLGVTTKTQWGETTPAYQTVTASQGGLELTITPTLGAYLYRAFLGQGGITAINEVGGIGVGATSAIVGSVAGYVVGEKIWLDLGQAAAEQVTITAVNAGTETISFTATASAHANGAGVQPVCSLVTEIPSTQWSGATATGTVTTLSAPANYFPETAPTTDTSQVTLPQELREAVRLLAMQILYEQNNLANRGVYATESGRKAVRWKSTEGTSGRGVPLYYQQATEILAPLKMQDVF